MSGELLPTNNKLWDVSWELGTHQNRLFRKTIFRLLLRSEIFTRAIDWMTKSC